MKNVLFIILMISTQLVLAQTNPNQNRRVGATSTGAVTWLFKHTKSGKEKILRKGEKVKILFNRKNYKEDYDTKGILLDIKDAHLVIAIANTGEQIEIEHSKIKKIVSSPKNGIFNNIFGGGLLLLGGGCLSLALLVWAFGGVASTTVLIIGLVGLLTTALGVSYSDKGNEQIIDQPFSDEWHIIRLDAGVQHLPSINNP